MLSVMKPKAKKPFVRTNKYFYKILILLFFLMATNTFAQTAAIQTASLAEPVLPDNTILQSGSSAQTENLDDLAQIARQFLLEKTKEFDGKTEILITPLDSRLKLADCEKPIPYLSQGAKIWGKTTVAIRCEAPEAWRIMVKAQVKIHTAYLTAAKVLPRGHIIGENDLALVTGDITDMRTGVLTDKQHAIGHTVNRTIQPGSAIWADQLKTAQIIQQGQTVTVISQGKGFRISSDGQAINNACQGQLAKVKMPNGKIVKGIAKSDGIIEVYF